MDRSTFIVEAKETIHDYRLSNMDSKKKAPVDLFCDNYVDIIHKRTVLSISCKHQNIALFSKQRVFGINTKLKLSKSGKKKTLSYCVSINLTMK